MKFASREEAGRRLGRHLVELGVKADLVLGLPRGGVVVAAEVARAMRCPLDVLIVRKIGHPWHREFAIGALAEPDVVIFDESFKWKDPLARAELDDVVAEEKERLQKYRSGISPCRRALSGRQNGFARGRRPGDWSNRRGGGDFRQTTKGPSGHHRFAGGFRDTPCNGCGVSRMKWQC